VLSLVALTLVTSACVRDRSERIQHGVFLFPKDQHYTVVILEEAFLEHAFGPGWQSRRLFYGYSGGYSEGVELATPPEPLSMLAMHPPMFLLAGNRWNSDLSVLIYDSESAEQITIGLDMVEPAIQLKSTRSKRTGRNQEHFLEDGRLTFK
jgi:hypothetical protein